MLTDRQRLSMLLDAEALLKRTTKGYSRFGTYWRRAMPMLWDVRLSFGRAPQGQKLAEAHGLLKQTEKGYDPRAPRWRRAMTLIDSVEESLRPDPVPQLGPIEPVGKSLLLMSLTHDTDGLFGNPRCPDPGSHWPALDFGWDANDPILAPERMTVIQQSSAMGADAFYARGASRILYWVGHIQSAPGNGTAFAKGALIARIAAIPGVDHGHFAVNTRPLIGRDLKWGRNGNGPDYTLGAPPIGRQLQEALAL